MINIRKRNRLCFLTCCLFTILSLFVFCYPQQILAKNTLIPTHAITDIDISIDDLEAGVSILLIPNETGIIIPTIASSTNGYDTTAILGTFHVGISIHPNDHTAHLYWHATGSQLTWVSANVFCKSTSILFPTTYFSGAINGYSDLAGQYNQASGITSDFSIPADVNMVKVGWSSASITQLVGGTINIGGASQAVALNW